MSPMIREVARRAENQLAGSMSPRSAGSRPGDHVTWPKEPSPTASELKGLRVAFLTAIEGVEQVELTAPWQAVGEARRHAGTDRAGER